MWKHYVEFLKSVQNTVKTLEKEGKIPKKGEVRAIKTEDLKAVREAFRPASERIVDQLIKEGVLQPPKNKLHYTASEGEMLRQQITAAFIREGIIEAPKNGRTYTPEEEKANFERFIKRLEQEGFILEKEPPILKAGNPGCCSVWHWESCDASGDCTHPRQYCGDVCCALDYARPDCAGIIALCMGLIGCCFTGVWPCCLAAELCMGVWFWRCCIDIDHCCLWV